MRNLLFTFVLGLVVSLFVACKPPSVGYNKGYMPEQPIPYDHAQHAGTYKIPCLFCHVNVDKSKHAGVPSLNICMNCHISVAVNSPHIKKLTEAFNKGESVPWVKVHMLPDFVRFNHAPHVAKFGKDNKQDSCYKCHGKVDEMKKVYQVEDLSMGWCVNCHRKPENNAPVNCSTCHY